MSTKAQPEAEALDEKEKIHWSKSRWFRRALCVLLVLIAYTVWQMWSIDDFGHGDDGSSADCGIVLGAAAWHNKPSPVFKARIEHAVTLYEDGRIKAIILTGGFGKGASFAESEVAKKYCIERGVPMEDIYIETASKTTEENITEAKKIMQAHDFKSSLIISDPWHLKRACNIAEHYEISAKPSATRKSLYTSEKSKLRFIWREFQYLHLWRFS